MKNNTYQKFNIDIEELLAALRVASGKDIFTNVKKRGNQYQCSCPFHIDKKPSFGINTEGIYHCFSCQSKGNVVQLVQEILNLDNYKLAEDWLNKHFNNYILETEEIPTLEFGNKQDNIKLNETKPIYISEEELKKYRVKHPYMYERKLNDDIIEKFDVGYDPDFKIEKRDFQGNIIKNSYGDIIYNHFGPAITFPIRDIDGNVVNIARRCINSKKFHYPENSYKPIYGLYELYKYKPETKSLWICESILDSLYLWTQDKIAVALNGLGSSEQFKQLEVLGIPEMILATDNDVSGKAARINIRNSVKNVYFKDAIIPVNHKDINECSIEEIKNIKII